MLNKNTKSIAHSPDDDTDFFDIISGIFQGDTSIQLIKSNSFMLKMQETYNIPQKL